MIKTYLFKLAFKSALNRKGSVFLAIMSIALSITLLLAVDNIRKQTKNSFMNTVSETDLIIGARSGAVNLLLYSVFHIGNATNNMQYSSYQAIQHLPEVKWAIPISLGDSHKGYRVIGTEQHFYDYFRYANQQPLAFEQGSKFTDLYDTVVGANVARKLGYQLNDQIVLAHGTHAQGNPKHSDKPFVIKGILKPTGTPIDNSIQVSLKAIEAIHIDWQSGSRSPLHISAKITRKLALNPKQITAMMVGLNSPIHTFKVQRAINQWRSEPLMAILPGATLAQLWQSISLFEKVLLAIASLVLVSALISMLITLLSTLNERRREMAVLRAIGMHSWDIIKLFMLEAALIMGAAILLGVLGLMLLLSMTLPLISAYFGLHLELNGGLNDLDSEQLFILSLSFLLAIVLSLIPGWMAYKRSLADGLTMKH